MLVFKFISKILKIFNKIYQENTYLKEYSSF